MWASPCVHYRGPRNVGLCRDTKVGERITPDSASSQVLENALVWRTEASPCDLQPKGREGMKSKFPLRNNSNCPSSLSSNSAWTAENLLTLTSEPPKGSVSGHLAPVANWLLPYALHWSWCISGPWYTQCVCVCMHAQLCLIFVTPLTIASQLPLSMGFSRQEYWSGLHFLL